MIDAARLPGVLLRSAACTCALRLTGASTGLVTCEGRLPRIHRGGRIRVGRLALRAPRIPIALGAEPGGTLEIGDRVFVNEGVQMIAAVEIQIGPDCRIGDLVAIHDSDYHPVDQAVETRAAPVTIGRNVWIARGAIVLPGVTIGDHAVVAAGSVVTSDVPARTLVAGNPARHLRDLTAADDWRRS